MFSSNEDHADAADRLDADAVCEQCDTVNPPGTLFCRTCGENLRDQRMRRLARPDTMPALDQTEKPRRVLAGLLTVFGILLILWVAMKVADGSVENWLTKQLTESEVSQSLPVSPEEFWTGPEASLFNSLLKKLEDNPVSLDDVRSGGKGVADGLEGRYFITSQMGTFSRAENSAPVVGYAIVELKGDDLYIAAKFSRIEVRAKARLREGIITTSSAALTNGKEYVAALGFARIREDGMLECQGQTTASNLMYSAIAHRVP